MTRSHEVSCFFFGCAVGVGAAMLLAPEARDRATKYLREKTSGGVDFAKKRVEDARDVMDDATAKAGKLVDRVSRGLDAAKSDRIRGTFTTS